VLTIFSENPEYEISQNSLRESRIVPCRKTDSITETSIQLFALQTLLKALDSNYCRFTMNYVYRSHYTSSCGQTEGARQEFLEKYIKMSKSFHFLTVQVFTAVTL
jgi:hypothetical protein